MRLIERNDLERWAESYDSKGYLPVLISRIVKATTPASTFADFPSGSAINIGGWDGVVNCFSATAYVPEGISVWEFGTEADSKGKADKDYLKRTNNSLGYDKSNCTFIFVTLRFWKKKVEWINQKMAEGVWKDVRVYDSSDLEQWFDNAPAVSRWFSSKVNKYPHDGILTTEEFWEEWSRCVKGEFPPKVVTAGREYEQNLLLNFLTSQPGIKAIRASTKNEATAFIIATAKQFPHNDNILFFSKSLIIDTVNNYRAIRINNTSPLNLIARFEDHGPLYAAVSKGNHVMLPLGADDTFNGDIIELPRIDKDGQIGALEEMGFDREDAEKFSREAGRNVTILRKLLGFPENNAKWLRDENVREIIPALLVGRWNDKSRADIELIEKISGLSYEVYVKTLVKWRDFEQSPLIQIGNTWRLTSPLDAWTNLASHLVNADLELLKDCFFLAYKRNNLSSTLEGNSIKNLSDDNHDSVFSSWSREGMAQSLVLIATYGNLLRIPGLVFADKWVDGIIKSLLFNASSELWISINRELPLLAEAAPETFLYAVNHSLSEPGTPLMRMFKEEKGVFSSNSNYTGLLWALEGLAWMPDYLFNVSRILLRLSDIDPGGDLINRPINSLIEIFKPWYYQTLTPFDERMKILERLVVEGKQSGWVLLLSMLPKDHPIAHPTNKMRWRMSDKKVNLDYTWEETYKTYSKVVDLLLSIFDNSEVKFAQLIEESILLGTDDRDKILQYLNKKYLDIKQVEYLPWNSIRHILSHHRSHPDTAWTLSEDILIEYEHLYYKLEPDDLVFKYIWLFNDYWPEFIEGNNFFRGESEASEQNIRKKSTVARLNALTIIHEQFGTEKIIELSSLVKEPFILGDTFAVVDIPYQEIFIIIQAMNNNKVHHSFIQGFFYRKAMLSGSDWLSKLLSNDEIINISNITKAQIFASIQQSIELWNYIDSIDEAIKESYWTLMIPNFYNLDIEDQIVGINHLIEHKRFSSAIIISAHFPDKIPTNILVPLLLNATTEISNEPIRFREYEINKILETLEGRKEIDHQILIRIEWLYFPLLNSHGRGKGPLLLNNELAKNPDFFIEIIKLAYRPKGDPSLLEDGEQVTDSMRSRAKQAYALLHSWKTIPGSIDEDNLDKDQLYSWINDVRSLSKNVYRADVVDMQIGYILAQFPESNPNWPLNEIVEILESINSEAMLRNFSTALFNKRGSSIRGAFDGGNIERGHSRYFSGLADRYKSLYPNVAEVFSKLSHSYMLDAKRQDEDAEREKLDS